MKDFQLNLNSSSLNELFPYYILINEKLIIERVGNSIPKVLSALEGKSFPQCFTFMRPFIENVTPEHFITFFNQLVVFVSKDKNGVLFRGQIRQQGTDYLFIGSPWLISMEEELLQKLSPADFAIHDPMLDVMHVLKNQKINNNELKGLLITVEEQRKQLKKDKDELNKLSLVASANKNGVVLTNSEGEILWCNNAYLKITEASLEQMVGQNILDTGPCKLSKKEEKESVISGFKKGILFESENIFVTQQGDSFWYKTTKQPIKNELDEVVYYFAVLEDITADKEREEQLLLLSSIAERNSNPVFISDKEGKIDWVNSSFLELTEYSLEEIIGQQAERLLYGAETAPKAIAYLAEQIKKGLPFDCEMINYSKSKKKYWVRTQGQALRDDNGTIKKYFTILEDISFEKEFNQQLIESKNRLNSIIANLQTGIILEDENRKVLLVNKKFCELFGITADPDMMKGFDSELIVLGTKGFFKNPSQFFNRIDDIIQKKEMIIAEEIELTDGRFFERSFIPIQNTGSQYNGQLWSYDDITLKKKYKESLEAEKEKYSNIIANMNMGLLEVDNEDTIQSVNQSFSTMSGYSTAELIGQKVSLLFLKNDKVLPEKSKKSNSDSHEINITLKSGEEKYWLISSTPNYNLNGEIVGTIGIHLDITEQKELEIQKEHLLKRLEKQNEQLNEYAQVVSHDLKSPLRSIHTLITWIKEDSDKELNRQTQEYLRLIEDKVEKMDNLIHGILMYSKVDSGNFSNEKVDLNEIVENTINIIHIPENILVTINRALPTIETDSFRMQQLFQNLISNAVTYNDKEKGLIEISYVENQADYIISIKDNGQGIEPKYQAKIFELFQSFSNQEKATGIGLSIVKRIIDFYQGAIWLESTPGIGTTFFIQLPKKNTSTSHKN